MLLVNPVSWGWSADGYPAAPNTNPGTGVAASATPHTMGTYTKLMNGSAVVNDVYLLNITFGDSFAGVASANSGLADIGIIPNDGGDTGVAGSVTTLVPYILVGGASASDRGPFSVSFPIFIPKNSSIWVRFQHNVGSRSVAVLLRVFGAPSAPVWAGSFAESIGTVSASSRGTAIACTNNAAWNTTIGSSAGNWHSLGTTTQRLRYLTATFANTATTVTAQSLYFGVGHGDGSNVINAISRVYAYQDTSERFYQRDVGGVFCDIPAGSTIYVRGHATGDVSAETVNALAVGIG